jgi:uncharacterized membrane protein YedE/YeeE
MFINDACRQVRRCWPGQTMINKAIPRMPVQRGLLLFATGAIGLLGVVMGLVLYQSVFGGGSTRMLLTLLFFIVGSVIGVTHLAWWEALPAIGPVSLIKGLGWPWDIILGALVAAGIAGKFKPIWHIGRGPLAASVAGGLLLGYGARLAYGCNLGAFFSGIASGSLHGWVWIACALLGTWAGIRLRPFFGLTDTPGH